MTFRARDCLAKDLAGAGSPPCLAGSNNDMSRKSSGRPDNVWLRVGFSSFITCCEPGLSFDKTIEQNGVLLFWQSAKFSVSWNNNIQ